MHRSVIEQPHRITQVRTMIRLSVNKLQHNWDRIQLLI